MKMKLHAYGGGGFVLCGKKSKNIPNTPIEKFSDNVELVKCIICTQVLERINKAKAVRKFTRVPVL